MTRDAATERRVGRRYVLTALGGATVGLSGCLGGLFTSDQSPSTITNTSIKPFKLVVTLREEATVNKVNLIAPDGTAVSRTFVPTGQTTVALSTIRTMNTPNDYSTTLSPGTYQIVVANGAKTVAQQEIQLTSSWELTDVQPRNKRDIAVTLRNTGEIPVMPTYLGMTAGAPTTTSPQKSGYPHRLGETKPRRQSYIGSGKQATFSSVGRHFDFFVQPSKQELPQWKYKALQCQGLTHTATLVLMVAPTGKRTYSVPVTYGGKPERGLTKRWCSKLTVGNVSRVNRSITEGG